MKYIQGQNRAQTYLFPISLEEAIGQDNEVRLIDLFVNSLTLGDYGFKVTFIPFGHETATLSCRKWQAGLPPFRFAKAVYIRLHEQNTFIKGHGKRI